MSQYVETALRAFTAGAAIAKYLRVKLSSGKLAVAGATDVGLGTLEDASFADGDVRAVRLRSAQGTVKMVAAGAISAGADVWAAASGKVNDVGGAVYEGVALDAAAADGDVIEVLRVPEPGGAITHHTASVTLTRAQRNSVHTNLGASAAVTLTLPQDAIAGDRFFFNAMTAQELRVDPGAAGAVYINGAKQADDKYVSFDDEGEHVTLTADGNGDWIAGPSNGTFTVEA
jgi:hypothetical protein